MESIRYRSLSFEPLKESDLAILYRWRSEPHVREFYQRKRPTWEGVRDKYIPRLRPDSPTKCFLVASGDPIGCIQTYRVMDWPEYAATIGERAGISVDLFIGEAAYIGKGWGPLILPKFLLDVAFSLFPEEKICWIAHDSLNHRALGASKAAGFSYVRDFVEEGIQHQLLRIEKEDAASLADRLRK
ncbi:MAG TPA: GNAT family N-acetyltransferase [Terriglobales bacterium]|nr:GNAT family N-acetyltransferase [Terriglobales bacterium]HYL65467.1 GNAT family N-acetyltransferase [Candidatus Methylomirabilis sp.]